MSGSKQMPEQREFPTAAIVSLSTGTTFCDFGKIHEAAEYLMGHPIWTHHFANEELWRDMQRTILDQHPDMPTEVEGVTPENYHEKIAAIEAKIGKTVRIRKGSGLTAMLPTDGIPDRLKDRTIIVDIGK